MASSHRLLVLFNLILAQKDAVPKYSDWVQITDELNDLRDARLFPDLISDTYLSSRYPHLQAACGKDEEFGMSQKHQDLLCEFAGFNNARDYEEKWELLLARINFEQTVPGKLLLLIPSEEKTYYTQRIQLAFHRQQQPQIELIEYADVENLLERVEHATKNRALLLLALPSESPPEEELEKLNQLLKDGLSLASNIIPIHPEPGEDMEKEPYYRGDHPPFYEHQHFAFVCQAVQHFKDHPPEATTETSRTLRVARLNGLINAFVDMLPPKWALRSGAFLLSACLLVLLLVPCLTRFQWSLLQVAVAVGLVFLGSKLLSKVTVKGQRIRGIASLALLGVLLWANPLGALSFPDCSIATVRGKVFMTGSPLRGALVQIPGLAQQDLTNEEGAFAIQWSGNTPRDSFQLLVSYRDHVIEHPFSLSSISEPFVIHFSDTIPALEAGQARKMIKDHIEGYQRQLQSESKSWPLQFDTQHLPHPDTLLARYPDFAYPEKEYNYRNYYHFEGPTATLSFKKNLLSAGIEEANYLEPSTKHGFEEAQWSVLEYRNKGPEDYVLEYALANQIPIDIRSIEPERVDRTTYRVRVNYAQNLRSLRVRLERTPYTGLMSTRTMTFYGFLPEEEYAITFTDGKWKLKPTSI